MSVLEKLRTDEAVASSFEQGLRLHFAGHVQLRMATDPDPTMDPRGLSGYTFALPGEPDFDGVLHFQPDEPGVWERDCGGHEFTPRVGVRVHRVERHGFPESSAPWLGARLSLVGARLAEYNGLVTRNDLFALDPVHVRVVAEDQTPLLERCDELDPAAPGLTLFRAGSRHIERRQPHRWEVGSEAVLRAMLPPSYRLQLERDAWIPYRHYSFLERQLLKLRHDRAVYLRHSLEQCPGDEALITRLQELAVTSKFWDLPNDAHSNPDALNRRVSTLAMRAEWSVGINGKAAISPEDADTQKPWPLRFWLGGWDADTLCAYISGHWDIALCSG